MPKLCRNFVIIHRIGPIHSEGSTMKHNLALAPWLVVSTVAVLIAATDTSITDNIPTEAQTITLPSGWNLMGAFGYSPQSVNALFNSGKVSTVWMYKNGVWQYYEPAGTNTIGSINFAAGLWVKVKDGQTFTIQVTPVTDSQSSSVISLSSSSTNSSSGINSSAITSSVSSSSSTITSSTSSSSSDIAYSTTLNDSGEALTTIGGRTFYTPDQATCQNNGGIYYTESDTYDGTLYSIPYCYQANWTEAQTICSASGGRLPAVAELGGAVEACGGTFVSYDLEESDYSEWNSIRSSNGSNINYQHCYRSAGFGYYEGSNGYWSSEEYSDNGAFFVLFRYGNQYLYNKPYANCVRCVR